MAPTLRLWNSLGRKFVLVHPSHSDAVLRIYHCGPTVYASPHIGNLRRFLVADLLVRTARFLGYEVRSVMNITDVGHLMSDDHEAAGTDRMLLAARREGISPDEIAAKYTQEFFSALTLLHAEPAQYYPRATMHIPQMIELTRRLLDAGLGYRTPLGVYLDVTQVPEYGKLSGNTLDKVSAGARVDVRDEKRHPADFALWIVAPKEHLMQWDSPWGRGYPGWHIECSAMAMHALGETLDIHTGGEDNMFPHHENEIAQSEGATGKPFAHIWLHNAHLLVEDKKMSKSEGTFVTLRDLLARGYDPRAFRLLVLQTHYRSKLNFTWAAMDAATAALRTLREFVDRVREVQSRTETVGGSASLTGGQEMRREITAARGEMEQQFLAALSEDLGSPQALAAVFDFVRRVNPSLQSGTVGAADTKAILDALRFLDRVLALLDVDIPPLAVDVPESVTALVQAREHARRAKRYAEADELRENIETAGYQVEDTAVGPRIVRRTDR